MILHMFHQTALRMLERYRVMSNLRTACCANLLHNDNGILSTEKSFVLSNDILFHQQYRVDLVLIAYSWFFGFSGFK